MNKLSVALFLFFSLSAWARPAQLDIIGQNTAPILSTTGNSSLYYDSSQQELMLSIEGGGYQAISTNNTAASVNLGNLSPTIINQSLVANSSNTFDIGSPSIKWGNGYFQNTITSASLTDSSSGHELQWNTGFATQLIPDSDNDIGLGLQTNAFIAVWAKQANIGNLPSNFFFPSVAIAYGDGHVKNTQSSPAFVGPVGGGASSCSGTGATDSAGMISMTSAIGSTGAQCSVNFQGTYQTVPVCQLTPANAQAATAATTVGVYVTTEVSPSSEMIVNFAVADTGSNGYQWFYHCMETQ